MKSILIILLSCLGEPVPSGAVSLPAPCGAVPSEQQIQRQRMERYAYVHFGPNTNTVKEWEGGDEAPGMFNHGQSNASKIVSAFKQTGIKGMTYTAEGTPEERLTAAEEEDPLRAADAKRKTHTETRTVEIVPGDNTSDTPFFYGRLKETGELFILRCEHAQGLAGNMLDL